MQNVTIAWVVALMAIGEDWLQIVVAPIAPCLLSDHISNMKRKYPVPNEWETKRLIGKNYRKSAKHKGSAQLESIKAKLDENRSAHRRVN